MNGITTFGQERESRSPRRSDPSHTRARASHQSSSPNAGFTYPVYSTRIPFVQGTSPPAAPSGFVYDFHEEIPPIAILLCILFFPFGIIFVLCIKQRYWLLQKAS